MAGWSGFVREDAGGGGHGQLGSARAGGRICSTELDDLSGHDRVYLRERASCAAAVYRAVKARATGRHGCASADGAGAHVRVYPLS